MAAFVIFHPFKEHLCEGVHNFASNQLAVALTNSAPTQSMATKSELTEVAYTNLSSRNVTTSSSALDSNVYELIVNDLTLTSSGGPTGPFRYVVLFNDTPTSPADPLIAYYDYGSSVTLADGETLTIDWDGTNGVFRLSTGTIV